ncbi:HdeD family acid-resistance protein [Hasllibacter sp. MH4015]|uniref:HdeD family acid-resistance protein n=1 Tax=Hasllibacter sp. MH4015 TaxID=2854029 RepID=UPI001CD5DE61|nr:HdeD family acid-resistance protein [Hasllibacter sp. MH4015]
MSDATFDARSGAPEPVDPVVARAEATDDDAQGSADRPNLNWKWMLFAGIVYLIGGFVAFLNPFVASLVANGLFAAAFLVGGAIAMWLAFKNEDGTTGGRLLGGLGGLLAVIFAVALWANPLAGLLSLTLTVAAFLLVMGVVRIWIGVRMREREGWGWIVASGVLTAVLGVMIFATLPASSLTILGLFLGVELTFAGVAHVATAWAARKGETA